MSTATTRAGTSRTGNVALNSRRYVTPAAREREARGSVLVSIAVAAVLLTGLHLSTGMFHTDAWLWPASFTAAGVVVISCLARAITGSLIAAPIGGLLGGAIGLVWGMWDQLGGELPDAVGLLGEALTQLRSDIPPIRESVPVIFITCVIVMALALIVDGLTIGASLGASALIPAAALVLIPVGVSMLTGVAGPAPEWLAAFGAAVALHLFATERWHRQILDASLEDAGYLTERRGVHGLPGSLTATAMALAAAAVIAHVMPQPSGLPAVQSAFGSGAGSLSTNRVNPLLDLGDDLRRPEPIEVFRYATSIVEGELPYFKLVTLTELDAQSSEWGPREIEPGEAVANGKPVPGSVPAEQLQPEPVLFSTSIVTRPGTSPYLPVPGAVGQVDGLDAEYIVDPGTLDMRTRAGDSLAQVFEVASALPSIGVEALGDRPGPDEPRLAALTSVPDSDATQAIRRELDGVIAAAGSPASPYARAQIVRDWLARSGGFQYSLQAPVDGGYDGSNLEVIEQFLQMKSGYCVHYASTMAVMARMLGIPARIAVGFTAGQQEGTNDTGQPVYAVTSHELHAWAELYVPGTGWMKYEATPSSGGGPQPLIVGNPEPAEEDRPATPEPQPMATEEAAPAETPGGMGEQSTPTPEPQPEEEEPQATGDETADGLAPGVVLAVIVTVLILLVLAAFALAPLLIRRARRRRRRAIATGERDDPQLTPGAAAWAEVMDSGVDYGRAMPKSQTPRRLERALIAATQPLTPGDSGRTGSTALAETERDEHARAREAITRIRREYERDQFGKPDAGTRGSFELWEDVETVSAAMSAAATSSAKRRAVIAPASVTAIRGRRPRRAPRARAHRAEQGDD